MRNYVIVKLARYRNGPREDMFFRDTMIRSERNYPIVIIAMCTKDSREDIFLLGMNV